MGRATVEDGEPIAAGRGGAGGDNRVRAGCWGGRCPALAQLLGWAPDEQGGQESPTQASLSPTSPGTRGPSAKDGLSRLHPCPFLLVTLGSVAILTKTNPFRCGEPAGGYRPHPRDSPRVCSER